MEKLESQLSERERIPEPIKSKVVIELSQWYSNDALWRSTYPFLFPQDSFNQARYEVEDILSLLSFDGTTVLDLCCGAGRHALEWARRGFQVTGVDQSAFLLEKAVERAIGEHLSIEWVCEDIQQYDSTKSYDLIQCLWNSFGLFGGREQDQLMLERIFKHLRPGGTILLDIVGKESMALNFQANGVVEREEGMMILRHKVIDDWDRTWNEMIVITEDAMERFSFFINLYSAREVKRMLNTIGCTHIQLFGNLQGDPYGTEATSLVAVGVKP